MYCPPGPYMGSVGKVMGSKLYVGNLAWRTDEDALRAAFEGFGPVREAKIITDRETGQSRGFAFVTFEEEAHAQAALAMDGTSLDGRSLRVNVAEDRRPGGGGGGSSRPPRRDANGGGNAPEVFSRGRDTNGGQRPPRRNEWGQGGGGRRGGGGGGGRFRNDDDDWR